MWLPSAAKHRLSIVQLHQTMMRIFSPGLFLSAFVSWLLPPEATRVEGQGRDCFRWAWGGGNHCTDGADEWMVGGKVFGQTWLHFWFGKILSCCRKRSVFFVGMELNLWWERMFQKLEDATEKAPHSCPALRSMAKNSSDPMEMKRWWDGSMPTYPKITWKWWTSVDIHHTSQKNDAFTAEVSPVLIHRSQGIEHQAIRKLDWEGYDKKLSQARVEKLFDTQRLRLGHAISRRCRCFLTGVPQMEFYRGIY